MPFRTPPMHPLIKRRPLRARVFLTCFLLFLLALATITVVISLAPDVDTDADIDASI